MNNPSFFLAGATEDIQVKALNNPRADGMVIIVGPTTQNEILLFEWSAHIWLSTCNPRKKNSKRAHSHKSLGPSSNKSHQIQSFYQCHFNFLNVGTNFSWPAFTPFKPTSCKAKTHLAQRLGQAADRRAHRQDQTPGEQEWHVEYTWNP